MSLTPAERKKLQRARDKAAGWTEVTIKVAGEHVEQLRSYARTLPNPTPPTDPKQLDLIDRIDQELASSASARK